MDSPLAIQHEWTRAQRLTGYLAVGCVGSLCGLLAGSMVGVALLAPLAGSETAGAAAVVGALAGAAKASLWLRERKTGEKVGRAKAATAIQ